MYSMMIEQVKKYNKRRRRGQSLRICLNFLHYFQMMMTMIGQVEKLTMTKTDDEEDWVSRKYNQRDLVNFSPVCVFQMMMTMTEQVRKNTIEGGGEGNPRGFARGKWFSNGIITHATENYSSA